jgi:chromate reductase
MATDAPSGAESGGARAVTGEIPWRFPMARNNIAVIVGSIRKDSYNRQLANALARLAPQEFEFRHVRIDDLPLYNQDDDANPHANVKRLKSEILAASALLFVTPEYNRSMPGVLKNAIDHASRPYGQSAWDGKPAGVIGCSPGAISTALAQSDLRGVLAYLNCPTLGQPEAYVHWKDGLVDAEGNIGAQSREFLQKWMDAYVAFVKEHLGGAGQERKAA